MLVERRSRWGRKSNASCIRMDSATAQLPGDYKDAINYNDLTPRDNVVALDKPLHCEARVISSRSHVSHVSQSVQT
jgi:hypothetical protein